MVCIRLDNWSDKVNHHPLDYDLTASTIGQKVSNSLNIFDQSLLQTTDAAIGHMLITIAHIPLEHGHLPGPFLRWSPGGI